MAPRFSKIMSKMQDEEDVPADIPNPEMYMPEPEREIAKPFPPGVAAQEAFDDMLQRRVVDPLSQAGYEDMGAGLAAIPSAAHSMIVPQTDLDVAGTIIPLPGVAKLMKKGKFRKISKAMHVEDPENAAKVIAEQAGKLEGPATRSPEEMKAFGKNWDEGMETLNPKDDMRRRAQKEKMEYDTYKIEEKQKPKLTQSHDGSILERILSRFEEPEAEKLRSVIKRDLDSFEGGNTYIGENFHKPVWQKPNAEYVQPIPLPPEYLDKVGNHVGKNIMSGGNDPFQWLDNKYGASKAWLEKTTGQTRIIETQSDLISHDDYMDKLTPKDKVVFHILGDSDRIQAKLLPGAASQGRVIKAAQKLADQGINVTIKRHNIPGRIRDKDAVKAIPEGIRIEEENLRLDPDQYKAIVKVTGNDFFNSPVNDADVAPLIQSGKDMNQKEFDNIYGFKSRAIAEPPKPPKGDPEAKRFRRIRDAMEGLEKYSVDPNDKYYQEWLKVKDSYRGTYKNWLKERMKKDQE